MSSVPLVLTLVNNMLHYRDVESYKQQMLASLGKRGYLVTELCLEGSSWMAFVRGTGWCKLNDLLSNRPTRVPGEFNTFTNTL